jgi:hypothetical protein
MHGANRDHKATLARMEQKFFEEKVNNSTHVLFNYTFIMYMKMKKKILMLDLVNDLN